MHSVRIELAKLILVGTRITYQATGDAGMITPLNNSDLQESYTFRTSKILSLIHI